MDEKVPGVLLAEVATMGAQRLLPGDPRGWPPLEAGHYPGTITPNRARSFRPVVRMDDADVQRVRCVGFILRRHPREAWYAALAVGWATYNDTEPDGDIAKMIADRFPVAA